MKNDSDPEVAIFTEALKLASQQRNDFVRRVCGSDEDLRRKVEALLKAHERLGDFLEQPPIGGSDD
jgi:hypothetical protein